MAKDNNESIPKLSATAAQQLRKLAAGHEHQFRKFAADLSRFNFSMPHREWKPPGQMIPMDEIGDSIPDELARLRELIVELKTPAPAPAPPVASSGPKKRKQPQVDRILRAIPEVYPTGIDGISDPVVHQKVAEQLQLEIKKGGAVPSPDSFERALRQYRTRIR